MLFPSIKDEFPFYISLPTLGVVTLFNLNKSINVEWGFLSWFYIMFLGPRAISKIIHKLGSEGEERKL